MKNNCWHCKHKESCFEGLYHKPIVEMKLIKESVSFSGSHYGKCNNGNTDKMVDFMKRTGNTDNSFEMWYPENAMTIGFYIGEVTSDVVYSAIHEFGGMAGPNRLVTIPERKYASRPMEDAADDILDIISNQIEKAFYGEL